jgi:hypothetical protein
MRTETVDRIRAKIEREYGNARSKPAVGAYIEDLIVPMIEDDEVMDEYMRILKARGVKKPPPLRDDHKISTTLTSVMLVSSIVYFLFNGLAEGLSSYI